MSNRSFGLDIGATTMKVVWLSWQKTGFLLNSSLLLPSPPKGMLSESPLDQDEMARAIKKLVDDAKITTPYVNIALSEDQVYTKVIEMPLLSDKELSSAIYWEAEQHIPVPLSNITLDWKVLKRPKKPEEQQKLDVLLVGAPTALIDKYEKIISMAGLIITSIETEILSAVRALVYLPSFENAETKIFPNSFIVNLGAVNTSFAIIKDGIIVFTYSIPTGGTAINRAIAADFGFSEAQAEEYKKVYGIKEDLLGGKIGKTTTPILLSIITEIKKALSFYNEKYKNEPIRQIILTGGTAKLPGINSFFAQNCGIETVIGNPWHILASQEIPKEILDNAPDYTIAVGLAMKDYE